MGEINATESRRMKTTFLRRRGPSRGRGGERGKGGGEIEGNLAKPGERPPFERVDRSRRTVNCEKMHKRQRIAGRGEEGGG